VFSNFISENRAVFEIMWRHEVESNRPQMTIWRVCFACWVPKSTNTHSEYVTFIASPQQQWLPEQTSTLRYTYFAFLVFFTVKYVVSQVLLLSGTDFDKCKNLSVINPLIQELNPSAQRCLTRFFTGNFAFRDFNFVNIRVKNQQMQQLFIQFINYVW
jgi:hypothetical protein